MALFVLQNNSYDRIGRLIVPCLEYCRTRGNTFEDRSLTSDLDIDAWKLDEREGLIVYGSVGWMKRFKASRYSSWIAYDEDAFAATTWVPILGNIAFNSAGEALSVEQVGERLESLMGSLHVRPDRDDKAFAGAVYDAASWPLMVAERSKQLGKDMRAISCWASRPREIEAEIRCWFVGGELVEASYYRKDGRMELERVSAPAVLTMLSNVGRLYLPCGNCVLDIAVSDGDLAVLEYNPIHSSGWYAADVSRVLDAWTAAVKPPSEVQGAIRRT